MTPFYEDESVTVFNADCLELLPTLADASVDAVVTDAPYGLEFMGREWDGANGFRRSLNAADAGRDSVFGRTSRTSPEYRTASRAKAGMSALGSIAEGNTPMPSFFGGLNPKCMSCGRWQRGSNPCRCEAPNFTDERLPRLHVYQAWCERWAAECARVLKPGGHLLAFGGTRTHHRLASAIEDAGFEIRDSITWIYGCLSADTEVLTEHGWRPGTDVSRGDRLAQWNPVTGAVELAEVQETFRAPWDGPLRVLRNADTDQLLTPNHRVYHQPKQRRSVSGARSMWYDGRWRVAEAGELSTYSPMRLPVAGIHDGPGIGGEDYAALLGWVWTEGGFDQTGTGVRIYQSSTNAAKVDEIAALMDRLGAHKRYDQPRSYQRRSGERLDYTAVTWFFTGDLANRVRTDLPGKRPTYDLLWRMTAGEKRALLRAAMLGDGTGCEGRCPQFFQKNEDDLIWLQTLLALVGQSGKVGMRPNRPGGAVYLRRRDTTEIQARHLRTAWEHYTGEVWCVRVPSGAFMARRNGKVFVTGNSGFPKSLDVSKAIDKAAGRLSTSVETLKRALRERFEASGKTMAQIDAECGFRAANYLSVPAEGKRPDPWFNVLPSAEKWAVIKRVLGVTADPELDAQLDAWFAEAEREVLGRRQVAPGVAFSSDGPTEVDVTAPATDEAKRWAGWGTALKPAWESVVVARKPVQGNDILDRIGSQLDALEVACRRHAGVAAESSAPTPLDSPEARTGSVPASAATPLADGAARPTATGRADVSPAPTATSWSEWMAVTLSNTVTSWRRCWTELCQRSSTSTTTTGSATTTDLTTLLSCISAITDASTQADPSPTDGLRSLVGAADSLFAAAVLRSRATLALSATESVTGLTPTYSPAGGVRRPNRLGHEPIVVARKPLAGTVAANVVTHGTGALNIDGCRVPHRSEADLAESQGKNRHADFGSGPRENKVYGADNRDRGEGGNYDGTAGRWPTNVVLSHLPLLDGDGMVVGDACAGGCAEGCPVAELDRQSGTLTSGAWRGVVNAARSNAAKGAEGERVRDDRDVDSGGASRFFPTFRYEAKADSAERPRVDGVAHPTVKPLALMRWLVRLVTPPGGTVLDPFAGSGTTAEACVIEGFRCLAIEREATYLPLIVARLSKPLQPALEVLG